MSIDSITGRSQDFHVERVENGYVVVVTQLEADSTPYTGGKDIAQMTRTYVARDNDELEAIMVKAYPTLGTPK